jgi:hypothetical protein
MRSATLSVTIGEVDPLAFLSLESARVHSEQVKPLNHEKIMPLCLAVGRARILRIDLAIHQPSYMWKTSCDEPDTVTSRNHFAKVHGKPKWDFHCNIALWLRPSSLEARDHVSTPMKRMSRMHVFFETVHAEWWGNSATQLSFWYAIGETKPFSQSHVQEDLGERCGTSRVWWRKDHGLSPKTMEQTQKSIATQGWGWGVASPKKVVFPHVDNAFNAFICWKVTCQSRQLSKNNVLFCRPS